MSLEPEAFSQELPAQQDYDFYMPDTSRAERALGERGINLVQNPLGGGYIDDTPEPPFQITPDINNPLYWYGLVELTAAQDIQPEGLSSRNQPRFAQHVHHLVTDHLPRSENGPHRVLLPFEVRDNLNAYYTRFPPGLKTILQEDLARIAHQKKMQNITSRFIGAAPEVPVVLGLRQIFFVRRQREATRATFALTSAYGATILGALRRLRPKFPR